MSTIGQETEKRQANAGLLPALGLFTITMIVIGGVIGSGIFRKPGIMAAQVGSPELLLGVWLLAGVITLFGALTNAEVAAMIPETGGQYIYYDRMYGPFVAYLYGWSVFAVIQTGSIAAVSYVFAECAAQFFPLPELRSAAADFRIHLPFIGDVTPLREFGEKSLAAALVCLLTTVNYIGVKFGGAVQNIFTVAKVTAMLLLALAAFLLPNVGNIANLTADSPLIRPQGLALIAAIVAAMQGAFWAYDGWNKLTYIAGEMKDPQRNLPRGLILGMLFVTAIYMLMTLAYVYVLPIDAMAKTKLVAADVAEKCFAGGGRWIAVAVMISTLGAANATILATARVYFAMARRNVFPQVLARAHPRFHTPGASLVVQGIWTVLLLFSGTFDMLTDTLIFVSWIFYAASAYGLFVLRRKEPATPRPYKVPGYPIVPWLFILFATLYLVFTIYNDFANYRAALAAGRPALLNCAFGLFLVLIGTPVYLFYRRKRTPGL
jgi:APA family basic amino acid/polyamine antiporter